MIDAVVFDLDGVLIDSEPVWEEVRRGLVDERGGRWPSDAQDRLMGMSTPEWARYLSKELAVRLPPPQVATTVVDRMAARYRKNLPLMSGATATLDRVAERWPLALASSSPRALIDTVLATAGWAALFNVTISTEEVGNGKPAPDVYLAAAERLRVAAHSCVAVEDSSNGLRSAATAGLRLVAIPQPRYPVETDALAGARVLGSLVDLDVSLIESIR
ncbi:MAG: HAD family hydrolase [Nocardioidaceae bacterium]